MAEIQKGSKVRCRIPGLREYLSVGEVKTSNKPWYRVEWDRDEPPYRGDYAADALEPVEEGRDA